MNNEKGISLIEVIASIIILSIVLISFFSYITNTFNLNSKNDVSIKAVNIVRSESTKIKDLSWESDINPTSQTSMFKVDTENPGYFIKNDTSNPDYPLTIWIKESSEPGNTYKELHLVRILLKDSNGNELSETYTYYERNVVSP